MNDKYHVNYSEHAPKRFVDFHKAMMRQLDEPDISPELLDKITGNWKGAAPEDALIHSALDNDALLLGRLVDEKNDLRMEPVWALLQRKEEDMDEASWWFYSTCANAYKWPKNDRQKQTEKNDARRDIADHLRQAARLLRRNPELELSLIDSLRIASGYNREWFEERGHEGLHDFQSSYMLNIMANRAEGHIGIPVDVYQPTISRAHRILFCTRLAPAIKERYGAPYRKEVAKIINTIFNKEALDDPINAKFVENNSG